MKGIYKIVKPLLMIILLLSLFLGYSCLSYAKAPYEGYNYSYWGETVASPIAYKPGRTVSGSSIGAGSFNQPRDLFVSADKHIYVVDTGNGRVVALNEQLEVLEIVSEFENGGMTDSFRTPSGIYVTEEQDMYIADTGNRRIVHLNADRELVKTIDSPQSDILAASFVFTPTKIVVDKAKRIYVVSQGAFDGLMEFDADGQFTGFTGTNRVRFNVIDYFWRSIATEEQRYRMELFIPTEYTNLDIDDNGFIYTTNSDANTTTPIKRLNPTGVDVLRRAGYWPPVGDLKYLPAGDNSGPSLFVDIALGDSGIYSALDARRGKVFTYDWDGNLLYIFGRIGNQAGTFRTPVAIARLDDSILVLDREMNRFTVFETTPIGAAINRATELQFIGDGEQSAEYWSQVIEYDSNYDIAYIGISKALLRQGLNEEATRYAQLGMDRYYYSKAFQRYRKDVLREHLGNGLTVILLLSAASVAFVQIRKKRGRQQYG